MKNSLTEQLAKAQEVGYVELADKLGLRGPVERSFLQYSMANALEFSKTGIDTSFGTFGVVALMNNELKMLKTHYESKRRRASNLEVIVRLRMLAMLATLALLVEEQGV
jgi:hypothetical protein